MLNQILGSCIPFCMSKCLIRMEGQCYQRRIFTSAGMHIKLYLDPEKFKKEKCSTCDLSLQKPMRRMLRHLSYQGGLSYAEGVLSERPLQLSLANWGERKKISRLTSLQSLWIWLHIPWLAKRKEWFFTGDTEITLSSSFPYCFHYFFCPPSSIFSKSNLIAHCS